MKEKPYRQNVGMIVFNRNGEVLMGERVNVPNAWQFPQGGIDDQEIPRVAALRELYEEMGIADAKLVKEHEEWLYYDFPADLNLHGGLQKYRGQMQKWFLFFWDCTAEECNLDAHEREFVKVQFMPLEQSADSIVEFKKQVYEQLIQIFQPVIKDYLASLIL